MNLYTLRHRNLNPACLPVPPYPQPIKSSALFQTMEVSYTIFALNATGDRHRFRRFRNHASYYGIDHETAEPGPLLPFSVILRAIKTGNIGKYPGNIRKMRVILTGGQNDGYLPDRLKHGANLQRPCKAVQNRCLSPVA